MRKLGSSLIFLIAFFFVTACSTVNDEKVVQLRQATFVFSDHQTPPAFNKNEEVTLPHNWNKSGLHGSAWYQVGFAVNEINPKETWSVFLPQVIMNAQVWLNGHVIGSGGSLEAPVARYWHTPLMLSFPTSLLKENNTLHIRLVGYTNQHAKLGIVELGPEALIQKRYSVKYFKAVTLNVISGVFTVLVGILLFSIWFKRRESEYFWFAISSVTWSLYSINIFTINIPISEEYWEKIVFLSSGWLAISIAFLLVRLDQFYYPKIESGLLLVSAILNVLVLVSPEQYMFSIFPIWLQFSFLVGCSGIGHFAWRWIVDRKKQSGIILMMILGIAMAGAHDIAVQSGWLEIGNILWLDYSLPLFFIAMSYLLVSRFLLALEEKESLNLDLENRVAEAGNLLEQNYRKILFMEKQQATTNERERIHRDLHDSIGAKLLSLVYRSENESEAELARSALTDLRNVVHQAPVSEQSLLEAVYEWELNCVERCLEAGRSVDFYIHHVPQTIDLAKSRIHNLAAILSEALTNSFRHSDSRNIRISIRYRLGALRFEVGEIGHFKNQRNWVEGCGMQNMRYRVEQLNGKITWQQSNRINRVIWTFPIEVKNNEE